MSAPSAATWLGDPAHGFVRAVRPSQLEMARLVEEVLRDGGVAAIEAGTGTGKGFAYGLPALLSGRRVVISTAKKTLQTQLFTKDLPHLTACLRAAPEGPPVGAFRLLKGKGNYACRLRVDEFEDGAEADGYDAGLRGAFAAWFAADPVGDLATCPSRDGALPFEAHVRVTECVRYACPFFGSCGYVANKRAAKLARVLVVNHALLAYDLALGRGRVLGPYDVLILDEAHQAVRYFRDAHTYRLHPRQPEYLERLCREGGGLDVPPRLRPTYAEIYRALPVAPGLLTVGRALRDPLAELLDYMVYLRDRFARHPLMQGVLAVQGDGGDGGAEGDDDAAPMVDEDLRVFLGTDANLVSRPIALDLPDAKRQAKLLTAATNAGRVHRLCRILLGQESEAERARVPRLVYTELRTAHPVDYLEVLASPVEVGPLVAPALLGLGRVVLTSATLATPNGFGYTAREFGLALPQLKHAVTLPSPFDYRTHSALYLSRTAPNHALAATDRDAYHAGMAREVHELLAASRGGAFVLCASRVDMQALAALLDRRSGPYAPATQSSNIDRDLAWFRKGPHRVLIGVKSLWEGVDVPGNALRLVIIPRLPFPNRADVLLTARKARWIAARVAAGDSQRTAELRAFAEFDLQEALMDLKQGGGRLIRTETDRGVVALLDSRAVDRVKNYSALVRAAFPHPHTYNKAQVLQLLEVLGAQETRPCPLP